MKTLIALDAMERKEETCKDNWKRQMLVSNQEGTDIYSETLDSVSTVDDFLYNINNNR